MSTTYPTTEPLAVVTGATGAAAATATGHLAVLDDGLEWYVIEDVDRLEPFLVTVTCPHDQWMFVSSSGGMTAGRRDAGRALFPYETDDRLHRSGGRVGPVTLVRVGDVVWQPFAPHAPVGPVRRSLAKTLLGDRLRFEEHHPGLGLTFRATLTSSADHGLVQVTRCYLLPAESPFHSKRPP